MATCPPRLVDSSTTAYTVVRLPKRPPLPSLRPAARRRRPEQQKQKTEDMKVSSSLQNSKTPALKSTPLYALRKAGNTWELTFAGNPAQIKDHPGMKYVAYLLLNPPPEPLFGLDLASKVQ